MPVRVLKPTTPGQRKMSVDTFEDITKVEPEKSLTIMLKKHSGRNAQGRITVRHRGGGAHRYYRILDFKQDKYDVEGKVLSIEYDPYRSGRIALVQYTDGEKRYVVSPEGQKVGDTLVSSLQAVAPKVGNRMPLKFIPVGQPIFSVELEPRTKGSLVRGAGVLAHLMALEGGFAQVQLPSGEVRKITAEASATIGQVSNPDHRLVRLGKAGRRRYRGWRPTVRGKAMNPVDHPHGGGEGHNPIGMAGPKTPWGKPALGVKTRKHGRWSDSLIVKRRK